MTHTNYHEITADSYFDLGVKMGGLFSRQLQYSLINKKRSHNWHSKREKASEFVPLVKKEFPHLIEELKGYAVAAGVEFEDLWTLNVESELGGTDRCTTVITNNGKLTAHNEDWSRESINDICVVKKTVAKLTIFELFYYNTLGGNAISINSNGFIQTINSLSHSDTQKAGIPKNIISRWLSETKNPDNDFKKFANIKRSSGYSHNFVNTKGKMWNIEASAKKQILTEVYSPYVHTNHYLSNLKTLDTINNSEGTFTRFNWASKNVLKSMSTEQVIELMGDTSMGRRFSILNDRTIASMIVDFAEMKCYVWLLRERQKGWIDYTINFLR